MDKSTIYIVVLAVIFAMLAAFIIFSYWQGKKQQKKIQEKAEKRLAELVAQGVPEEQARTRVLTEVNQDLEKTQQRNMLMLGPIWIVLGGVLILFNGPEVLNVAMVVIGLGQLVYALVKKPKKV